jgi:hypothetical protein
MALLPLISRWRFRRFDFSGTRNNWRLGFTGEMTGENNRIDLRGDKLCLNIKTVREGDASLS